jgi:hypothetical protein
MKAEIVCQVCEAVLGTITRKVINDDVIESYRGCFICDCGGQANLVIVE